ncbi:phage tail tape measure protein [Peptoniphilus sp. EMRHCC_23]|uniref:phage tail tape measure protein n=1 Tax=Peptoniphilus rachelemmaiella TaxID=2811779 RepID=UPI001C004E25|nr:phage tail tape measure protein [Peptoniphilus rachelemmaiella]
MASDGKLIFDTELNDSGFKKGMSKLGKVTGKFAKGTVKAIAAVSTAIGGVGLAAVKVGSDFESGMSQVAATMGFTQEQIRGGSKEFKQLEAAAREMGATTQFSATQASEALNYIALAGYDADDAIKLLPKTLNLAAAGGLDLGYATDIVTDAMSALGLSIEDADSFIDQMAKTSQKSNTNIAQLGEAILTVGGTAKDLAGGTVELNTALGILANNGIKGAEGGTKLRNVIMSLTAPTDKARKAMESLGISAFDAEGNMRPLKDVFRDISLEMANMTTAERKEWLNTVFNKQDLAAVSALLAANATNIDDISMALEAAGGPGEEFKENIAALGKEFDQFADKQDFVNHAMEAFGLSAEQASILYEGLKSSIEGGEWNQLEQNIRNSAGAAEEMAKVMIDNLKGDLVIMKSALEELGIAFYQTFQGDLRTSVSTATGYIDALSMAFRGLDMGELKSNLEDAGISVDELGINLVQASFKMEQFATKAEFVDWAMQQFGLSSEQASTLFDQLAASMENSGSRMELIGKVIGETMASVIADISGVAPQFMQLGIDIIQQLINGVSQNIGQIGESVSQIATTLIEGVTTLLPQFLALGAQLIVSLVQGLAQNAPQIGTSIMAAIGQVASVLGTAVPQFIQSGAQMILGLAQGIGQNIPQVMTTILQMVVNIADSVIGAIPTLIQAGGEILKGLAQGIAQNLPLVIQEAPRLINKFASAVYSAIPQVLMIGIQIIGTIAKGLIQAIPTLIANIPQIILAIINVFSLANLASVGKGLIKSLGAGIKSGAETIYLNAMYLIERLKTGLLSDPGAMLNSAVKLIQTFIGGIATNGAQLLSTGVQLIGRFIAGIGTQGPALLAKGADLLTHLAVGIIQGIPTVLAAVPGIIAAIGTGIVSAGSQLISAGGNLIKSFASGLLGGKGEVESASRSVGDAATSNLDDGGQSAEKGRSMIDNFLQELLSGSGEASSATSAVMQSAVSGLDDGGQSAALGDQLFRNFVDPLAGGAGEAGASAASMKDAAVANLNGTAEASGQGDAFANAYNSQIKSKAGDSGSAALALSDAAVNKLKTAPPKTKSAGTDGGKSYATGFEGTRGEVQAASKSLTDAAVKGAQTSKSQMQAAGSQAGQAFAAGFKSQVGAISSAVSSAMTSMVSGVNAARGQMQSAMTSIINGLIQAISTSKSRFQNEGCQLMTSTTNGIRASQGQVVSAIRAILNAAVSAANSYRGRFVSVGRNMSAGMASGIRAGRSGVISAAISVASSALKAARRSLDIHSPSKKMAAEVGLPAGQGIAVGLEDSMPAIEQSMQIISDGMIKSMTDQHMNMALFERREVEERHRKLTSLGILNIGKMYESFQALHKEKIQQVESEIEALENQAEKRKSGKKSEARKKDLEADKKALEEKKKNLEDYAKAFDETYGGIVSSYEKAAESIKNKAESLKQKLIDYGDVLEVVRDAEGKVVKNEFGEDMLKLTDLEPQVQQVAHYGSLLDRISEKGADADAIGRMLTLDIDKAVKYGEFLLNQSQEGWDRHMDLLKRKRNLAESIAKKYYDRELKNLKGQYTDKLVTNLEEIVKTAGEVGKKSADKLTKGFDKNKDSFIKSVKDVLNQMRQMAEMEVNATIQQSQHKLNNLKTQISNAQGAVNNINVYPQAAGPSPYQAGTQMGRGIDRELRRRGI